MRQRERMKTQVSQITLPGAGAFDEQIRQNMALFDRAMKMFSPFAFRPDEAAQQEPAAAVEERRKESDDIAQLRAQMAQMQEQLAALAAKK
jgi:polyhydroxyalkanoate synthesis regulator protein